MHLLLFFLLGGLCVSTTVNAQFLTPIQDSTDYSAETFDRGYHFSAGIGGNVLTGNQQMRDLTENLGFDEARFQNMYNIGIGARFLDRCYLDFFTNFHFSDHTDIDISNDRVLSLDERNLTLSLLFGYRFWQNERQGLKLWAGLAWTRSQVQLQEFRNENFDFNTFSAGSVEDLRNWPLFTQEQAALHVALEFGSRQGPVNVNNRRQSFFTGTSTEWAFRMGYVRGLSAVDWDVQYGTTSNAPADTNEYLYLTAVYYLATSFPKR